MKIRKEREKKRLVPYLNGDIMWNIFNKVPAISIAENCMFLRKQWSDMFFYQEFLKAHFLRSTPGMMFVEKVKYKGMDRRVIKFVEFQGTKITDVHLLHIFKKKVTILSHSGGLFLTFDVSSEKTHVINPITKESIRLPTRSTNSLWMELVSDQACMNYRIVDFSHKPGDVCHERGYVLTLFGSDGSCKRINIQDRLYPYPVLINGILYCESPKNGIGRFDLSTDTFSYLKCPIKLDDTMTLPDTIMVPKLLNVGGSLCYVQLYVYVEKTIIWILRQQKWVEICRIDSRKIHRVFGCPGNEDLFLFVTSANTLNAYDVKTKQWTMIKPDDNTYCYGVCVSSILPLTSR